MIVTEYTKSALKRRRIEKLRPHVNGCHSVLVPMNRKSDVVRQKGSSWPYIFTRTCQYDNKDGDIKCNGCEEKNGNGNAV